MVPTDSRSHTPPQAEGRSQNAGPAASPLPALLRPPPDALTRAQPQSVPSAPGVGTSRRRKPPMQRRAGDDRVGERATVCSNRRPRHGRSEFTTGNQPQPTPHLTTGSRTPLPPEIHIGCYSPDSDFHMRPVIARLKCRRRRGLHRTFRCQITYYAVSLKCTERHGGRNEH